MNSKAEIANLELGQTGVAKSSMAIARPVPITVDKPAAFLVAEFSPDGKRLFTFAERSGADVWKSDTGAFAGKIKVKKRVQAAIFSSKGEFLLTVSGDLFTDDNKVIERWNTKNRELVNSFSLDGIKGANGKIALSPDDKLLAVGTSSGPIALFDASKGSLVGQLVGHQRSVNGINFDSSGARLVSGSSDGSVRIWDVQSRKTDIVLDAQKGTVGRVRFDPEGKFVAALELEGASIKIWSLTDGHYSTTLVGHDNSVRDVAFIADGGLVSVAGDNSARRWHFRREAGADLEITLRGGSGWFNRPHWFQFRTHWWGTERRCWPMQ